MGSRSGSDAGCGVKIFEFSFFKLLLNISNPDSIRNAAGLQAFVSFLMVDLSWGSARWLKVEY